MLRLLVVACGALLLVGSPATARAADDLEPWQAYQQLDSGLFDVQLGVTLGDRGQSDRALARVTTAASVLAGALDPSAPKEATRLRHSVDRLKVAIAAGGEAPVAVASARTQTAALAGSFAAAVADARRGNPAGAQRWLLVRGFEVVTRYSHPDAGATVAVRSLRDGVISKERAARAVEVDLLDTYESLVRSALAETASSARGEFPAKTARAAAAARGYWLIIRPAYVAQRGTAPARRLDRLFDKLVGSAAANDSAAVGSVTDRARYDLLAFRAAPLAPAEQARRAGQLTRFLGLVPIEYARGVAGGTVTVPIEIQEAITFRDGAAAAFGDLQSYLARTDAASTRAAQTALDQLQTMLADTARGSTIATRQAIEATAAKALASLDTTYPDEWKGDNTQADFDVIATLLQKVGAAVAAGDYRRAESSRLEAYATFELGPEQHLRGLAPALFQRVEGLFWYGADGNGGLAQLVRRNATGVEAAATLAGPRRRAQGVRGGDR